jgi:hypothetical protein
MEKSLKLSSQLHPVNFQSSRKRSRSAIEAAGKCLPLSTLHFSHVENSRSDNR